MRSPIVGLPAFGFAPVFDGMNNAHIAIDSTLFLLASISICERDPLTPRTALRSYIATAVIAKIEEKNRISTDTVIVHENGRNGNCARTSQIIYRRSLSTIIRAMAL